MLQKLFLQHLKRLTVIHVKGNLMSYTGDLDEHNFKEESWNWFIVRALVAYFGCETTWDVNITMFFNVKFKLGLINYSFKLIFGNASLG